MSDTYKLLFTSNHDNNFLSSVRNACILLLIGIALLDFGHRFTKIGPLIILLSFLLFVVTLYNYWKTPRYSNTLNVMAFVILALTITVGWIFHEAVSK